MSDKKSAKGELEFVTEQEDGVEQERLKRKHAETTTEKKDNRRATQRREGVDRREMIRFEDERREADERRKGTSTGWDTL